MSELRKWVKKLEGLPFNGDFEILETCMNMILKNLPEGEGLRQERECLLAWHKHLPEDISNRILLTEAFYKKLKPYVLLIYSRIVRLERKYSSDYKKKIRLFEA